nr:cobyric acid synthase [Paracidobacterium acidisoli]
MVLGTGSHVGKSLVTAALCRIFARAGYRVAPFKAQNMSLNSAATPEGLEIGRAQALQAEAAGVPPSVHMNPILLKPTGHASSQVIVHGKVWKTLDAKSYHEDRVLSLLPFVEESYRTLAAKNDILVLEGAGSPAEINLKRNDIVNMRMAALANAPCLLTGDIDRGGVFASLLGTMELLDEEERSRIRGFIINKFRGDLSLLMPGVRMMEDKLNRPCLGVIPYLSGLLLDEEDGVALEDRVRQDWNADASPERALRIAVIALPSLSNFTDFDALRHESSVSLRYISAPHELALADVVILPGSKQTIHDLRWLKDTGFAKELHRIADTGGTIVGICGGFQMLGEEIRDPYHMEGDACEIGLHLLPVRTTMTQEKITVPARGTLLHHSLFAGDEEPEEIRGYEIHLGETEYLNSARPFALLSRATDTTGTVRDGCASANGRIFGTYLHGLFDEDGFRHWFVRAARAAAGLTEPAHLASWKAHRETQLNRLTDEFGRALDLEAIFRMVKLTLPSAISRTAVEAR